MDFEAAKRLERLLDAQYGFETVSPAAPAAPAAPASSNDSSNESDVESDVESDQVSVVEFQDPSIHRQKAPQTIHDYKQFMTSKVAEPTKKKQNRESDAEEEDDERNDKELMDILKTANLIEQYRASELTGKDRIKYQQKKLVELGGKKPKAVYAPQQVRLGMRQKAIERTNKKVQVAKDMGLYHSSLKTQIMGHEAVVKNKKKKRSHSSLDKSIGKFKNGVMHISKSHLEDKKAKKKKSSLQVFKI